jgi:hypothetical protein
MPLPSPRTFSELAISESTTSIATSPVNATAVAPVPGYVQRVMAAAGGTTTGTIAVAVSINGGSDIANSALTIAAGTGARAGTVVELPLVGAGATSGVFVNEGDQITFTPSGGTGASIGGAFGLVIRALV